MEKELSEKQYEKLKSEIKFSEKINPNLLISIGCFIFIFIIIFIFTITYLLRPTLLFSPPETIGEFLKNLDSEIHKILYINSTSEQEKQIINNILSNYTTLQQTNKSKSNTLIIGTLEENSNKPFSTYLDHYQGIAILDIGTNNLYIYSNNQQNLKTTLHLLNTNIPHTKIRIHKNKIEKLGV
jgi:hypothetical protein